MPSLKTTMILDATLGGEICRAEISQRIQTIPIGAKHDVIKSLPDLSAAATFTLWDWSTSAVVSPRGMVIVVDPDDAYTDNLTTQPAVTVEVQVTDTDGSSNPVSLFLEVSREVPLVLPSYGARTAISTATATRILRKVQARNNQASGYGSIKVRCLAFA